MALRCGSNENNPCKCDVKTKSCTNLSVFKLCSILYIDTQDPAVDGVKAMAALERPIVAEHHETDPLVGGGEGLWQLNDHFVFVCHQLAGVYIV